MKKCALSLTVHESEICVLDQCLNNVVVGDFAYIVVHINVQSIFNTPLLLELIERNELLNGKIIINPERLDTNHVGHGGPGMLHRAHISNYFYLKTQVDFDVICLDASNSLLIKHGLTETITAGVGINQRSLGENGKWSPQIKGDLINQLHSSDIRLSQHEGMFFPSQLFGNICTHIRHFDEQATANSQRPGNTLVKFPREEVLFSTFYNITTNGAPTNPPYIARRKPWFKWEKDGEVSIVNGKGLAQNKFGIKKVTRDINDPLRVMIGENFGYRREIETALSQLG